MLLHILRTKIHRATVTDHNLEYEGSLTLDADLVQRAGLHPYEKIAVWDVTNGSRFETYVIAGPPGSGVVCVNGAAAHLAKKGDIVIIAAYGLVDAGEVGSLLPPKVLRLDAANRPLPDDGPERLP